MAPLACLLQELGHEVRGVDGPLYPPMSTLLEKAGIQPLVGFDPKHLSAEKGVGLPDLVIVGNAVPRSNPEAVWVEGSGLERISMPEAVARFLLRGRRPLVVAGTHGKTTTTSMAAWVYRQCGQEPGYLIGGIPKNLPGSFFLGAGERFIVEGDEYNASYFDRGAKFLHYLPETAILTSADYDHADLYPTPASLLRSYESFVGLLPSDGFLAAYGDSPEVRAVAAHAACPVVFYGFQETNDIHPKGGFEGVQEGEEGSRCSLSGEGRWWEMTLPVPGRHNLLNAMAVWAVARRDGLDPQAVASALGVFAGAKRRLEELGTAGGVTVVDDFAHHPTAVAASLGGLRSRYPGRRRVVLFEPRSLTAGRNFFQQAYGEAFSGAHRVLLAPIFHADRLGAENRLDIEAMAQELCALDVETTCCDSLQELHERALEESRPGDVLVTMSSGDFAAMPRRLLEALTVREAEAETET